MRLQHPRCRHAVRPGSDVAGGEDDVAHVGVATEGDIAFVVAGERCEDTHVEHRSLPDSKVRWRHPEGLDNRADRGYLVQPDLRPVVPVPQRRSPLSEEICSHLEESGSRWADGEL